MFVSEPFDAFQLDHKRILDNQIREVLADVLALVGNWTGSLSDRLNAAKVEFHQQRAFVDLLELKTMKRPQMNADEHG